MEKLPNLIFAILMAIISLEREPEHFRQWAIVGYNDNCFSRCSGILLRMNFSFFIVITVFSIYVSVHTPNCFVVYDGPHKAKMVDHGAVTHVIAGSLTPQGLTCDNWDQKLQQEIYDKYPIQNNDQD